MNPLSSATESLQSALRADDAARLRLAEAVPRIAHVPAWSAGLVSSLLSSSSLPHSLKGLLPDVRALPDFATELAARRAGLRPVEPPREVPLVANAQWTAVHSRELAAAVEDLRREVREDGLPLEDAAAQAAALLDALQAAALDGKPAGRLDEVRHGQRLRVVQEALAAPADRLRWAADPQAEPHAETRAALLARAAASRRGLWEGKGLAPDAPSMARLRKTHDLAGGANSQVLRVRNGDGVPLVVKRMTGSEAQTAFGREIGLHQRMLRATDGQAHPQLVRLYGQIDEPASLRLTPPIPAPTSAQKPRGQAADEAGERKVRMLVLESLAGPDAVDLGLALHEAYERGELTIEEHDGTLLYLLDSLADVVDGLHAAGVGHNDVKPENFVLDTGGPVLIDLDLAAPLGEPAPGYTEGYEPPERSRDYPRGATTDVADAYGIGATIDAMSQVSLAHLPGSDGTQLVRRPKLDTPLNRLLDALMEPDASLRLVTLAARLDDAACDRAFTDAQARAVLRRLMDRIQPGPGVSQSATE